jgi:hypothetical protein
MTNTATDKPIRTVCFGATGFHPDIDRMPPIPDIGDEQACAEFKAAEQQQKSALSEADLAEDAKELITDAANHWCYGVYACMCGAIVKAFDFAIDDDEIAHTCRHCHERLLAIELYRGEAMRPPICEECGVNRSDPPSKLCPGCQAYQEHQR